jgi:hypothetical protein
LCQSEFISDHEADGCWHAFLSGVRTKLSPGEIAKIQDAVGVTGEYHHGRVRCAVQTQRLTRL